MKKFGLSFLVLIATTVIAQQRLNLHFSATYQNQKLQLHKNYFSTANNDSVSFSTLKFYVGKIVLYQNNKKVFSISKYHLMDINGDSVIQLNIPTKINYNSMAFILGVDSATNAKPSFKEYLDPRKGMYWAWHSGYINLKLEGKSPVCSTVNNSFQFHLGGFLNNQLAAKEIRLKVKKAPVININLNIEQLINSIDLKTTNLIMTPGKQSVTLSQTLSNCFSTQN